LPGVEDCVSACAYAVPAPGLKLSVILFLSCSICGFLILIMRRAFVKGELGGSSAGRYGSAAAFVMLWFIYVIFATLSTYKVPGFDLDDAPAIGDVLYKGLTTARQALEDNVRNGNG